MANCVNCVNGELVKQVVGEILCYRCAHEVCMDGVTSPVFYNRSFCIESKYQKKIRAMNAGELAGCKPIAMPSSSLARALVEIASGRASVGLSSTGESIAELVCTDGSVQYAVYNSFCGRFKACIVPRDGKTEIAPYKIAPMCYLNTEPVDGHHPIILVLALLPFLMEDDEFNEGYNKIISSLTYALAKKDISKDDAMEISEMMTIISDNANFRIGRNDLESCICIDFINFAVSDSEKTFPILKLSDVKSGGYYYPVNTKIGKFSTL